MAPVVSHERSRLVSGGEAACFQAGARIPRRDRARRRSDGSDAGHVRHRRGRRGPARPRGPGRLRARRRRRRPRRLGLHPALLPLRARGLGLRVRRPRAGAARRLPHGLGAAGHLHRLPARLAAGDRHLRTGVPEEREDRRLASVAADRPAGWAVVWLLAARGIRITTRSLLAFEGVSLLLILGLVVVIYVKLAAGTAPRGQGLSLDV